MITKKLVYSLCFIPLIYGGLISGCATNSTQLGRGVGIDVSSLESTEVMYEGRLPCNNCEAINLEVLLDPSLKSFDLTASYVDHPNNAEDERYSGVWSARRGAGGDSSVIVYKLSPYDGQDYFFMRIGREELELIGPNLARFRDGENLRIRKVPFSGSGGESLVGVRGPGNVRAANECIEEYRVYQGGIDLDNVQEYLSCIDGAERAYGRLEERMEPIEPGSSIMVNVNHQYHPGEMKLSNGMILRKNQWDLMGSFLPQDRRDRDVIIDAFSRYWFGHDRFDNVVKVEPLRYISGPYSQATYVSLRGEIKNGSPSDFRLVFKYYGRDWIFAERILVNVDGENFDLGRLNFSIDHTDRVWEIASIPLRGQGLRIARAIANGEDAVVRFVGPQYYHDFSVPRSMKDDLKAMLDALSAI